MDIEEMISNILLLNKNNTKKNTVRININNNKSSIYI